MVRLVKGAYWDSEIKRAQERGLAGYPVFTRKASTDVSYLACAQRLLADADALLSAVRHPQRPHPGGRARAWRANRRDFEFQRLHGMGEALYEQVVGTERWACRCRIYAPVGSHEDLLAYLVRRLLENGANTSFVNRIVDDEGCRSRRSSPIRSRASRQLTAKPPIRASRCRRDLFGAERRNSRGIDLDRSDAAAGRSPRPMTRPPARATGARRR